MHVALIQPRSPWGAWPYLPNGLLSVAARLQSVGIQATIIDENLGDDLIRQDVRAQLRRADLIGIGAVGSPYIPEALRVGRTLRCLGHDQPIAIGGEVIMRLKEAAFDRIFGELGDVRHMATPEALDALVGEKLPNMFETSMAPAILALPERARRAYFSKEWSLFVSQGCIFSCGFCAASKGRREQFRDSAAFEDELGVLTAQVKDAVGSRAPYEVYLSTLDGCQTPSEMERTLCAIAQASRKAGVFFPMRFLATAKCTVRVDNKDPHQLSRWHRWGLQCIGIGADGPGRDETRKHKAFRQEEDHAFAVIRRAGIQPEATMVLGLPSDGSRAFREGIRRMVNLAFSGVRPRPLMGKEQVPGNEGWEAGGPLVDAFLDNPSLFRELDFGGLGSKATHPNQRQRWSANAVFFGTTMALKALSPTGCPTQPLMPTESVGSVKAAIGHAWNRLMPQDR